jgi:hypothetical protein
VISTTSFGSTQWTRERTSGDPKRVFRGGGTLRGDLARLSGSRRRRIGKYLIGHPGTDAAGIDELAIIGVVAEQQRSEMRPRAFWVRPADNDELLAVEPFGFAP